MMMRPRRGGSSSPFGRRPFMRAEQPRIIPRRVPRTSSQVSAVTTAGELAFVNRAYSWWCVAFNSILFIWLLVISIIYFYGYADIYSDAKHLKNDLEPLEELIYVDYANCCEEIIPSVNFTCNGTGLEVLCWDANLNIPTIQSSVPPTQDTLYVVCTAGSTLINGHSDWEVGDYLRFSTELGIWLQNKASGGSGITSESFNLQYYGFNNNGTSAALGNITCTAYDVDSTDGWFLLRCDGISQGIVAPTSGGYSRVITDQLPAAYQVNTSTPLQNSYRINIPALREVFVNATQESTFLSVDLTDIIQFAVDTTGSYFIAESSGGTCVGPAYYSWSNFWILYNTDPPDVTVDVLYLQFQDNITVWEWGDRITGAVSPDCGVP